MDIRIIPAVLSYDLDEYRTKLGLIEDIVDRVQIDVVGREFSSKTSMGVEALEEVVVGLAVDVQLMVKEPAMFLNRCDIGGVDRVFGHVEYMKDRSSFIGHAFSLGMQVGLAFDLKTPVSEIGGLLGDLDAVLLMSVPAGKSGQIFNEKVLEKIQYIRKLNANIPICVDGGINDKNIGLCVSVGANEFAVGNYLWESKDIKQVIEKLMEVAK